MPGQVMPPNKALQRTRMRSLLSFKTLGRRAVKCRAGVAHHAFVAPQRHLAEPAVVPRTTPGLPAVERQDG